jgi:probable HAF family extracellular repeat protein
MNYGKLLEIWSSTSGCTAKVRWDATSGYGYPSDGLIGFGLMNQHSAFTATVHNLYGKSDVGCFGGGCRFLDGGPSRAQMNTFGAFDINNAGQVVGLDGYVDMSIGMTYQGFLWDQGVSSYLPTRIGPADPSDAYTPVAINDAGQVVANHAGHAYLWENGVFRDLGAGTGGSAINASGVIAGNTNHAFTWHDGTLHDLGTLGGQTSSSLAINAPGHVLGVSETASGQDHLFFWDGAAMQDLGPFVPYGAAMATPLADGTIVTPMAGYRWKHALNDAGQVALTRFSGSSQALHAALWQQGSMKDLGTLPGHSSSYAVAINSWGQVAGESLASSPPATPPDQRVFVYDPNRCSH